jgi:RIO-like serine/threonine protein kinase
MRGINRHWRIIRQQGASPELVQGVVSDIDALLGQGETLKASGRCAVVRLHGAGGAEWTARRFKTKGPWHTAAHGFLRSKALWSWRNATLLSQSGLDTPEPVLCAEERCLGVLRMQSVFVTRYAEGRSLWEMVASGELRGERLIEVAAQFGRIWETFGRLGIGHGDMKATNFIVDSANRIWMIDLDSMRVHKNGPLLVRRRRQDLERFMRNWQAHPTVAAAFSAHLGMS